MPHRSAGKAPQYAVLMGKSSKKRADGSKWTAANPNIKPNPIAALIFDGKYPLTREENPPTFRAARSNTLSTQHQLGVSMVRKCCEHIINGIVAGEYDRLY
jgi:hypothetical protein